VQPQGEQARAEQLNLSPAKGDVFDEALSRTGQQHGVLWQKMESKMTGLLTKTLVVADAFDAWVEWTVREIRVEMLFSKAVRRMTNELSGKAIDAWRINTVKMRRVRAMMARRVLRGQARAFTSWRTNADAATKARQFDAAQAKVLERIDESDRRVVKAALQKMQKRETAKVVSKWRSLVVEANEIRHRMIKVIKRVGNIKLAVALAKWVDTVVEAHVMRHKMATVVKRAANLKAAFAYKAWSGVVQVVKRQRIQEELESVTATQQQQLAAVAEAADQQFKEYILRKALRRMVNLKVSSCFSTWKGVVWVANQRRSQAELESVKAMRDQELGKMRVAAESDAAEIMSLKAELATYKAEHEAFEKRLDSLMGLPDFAIGAERLRRKGTPRDSGSSPIRSTSRAVREGERSSLRARAATKS
jgi:hypothetical protein